LAAAAARVFAVRWPVRCRAVPPPQAVLALSWWARTSSLSLCRWVGFLEVSSQPVCVCPLRTLRRRGSLTCAIVTCAVLTLFLVVQVGGRAPQAVNTHTHTQEESPGRRRTGGQTAPGTLRNPRPTAAREEVSPGQQQGRRRRTQGGREVCSGSPRPLGAGSTGRHAPRPRPETHRRGGEGRYPPAPGAVYETAPSRLSPKGTPPPARPPPSARLRPGRA
jgi:hypothetical protein